MSSGKGLNGLVDHVRSAFTVEPDGHFNAGLSGADRALGAGVEVAVGAAAHGGGLAMESAGHEVTAFGGHGVLSCGCTIRLPPLPPYPPGVFGANCLFSMRWSRGSTVGSLF